MIFEVADKTMRERRRQNGEAGTPMPFSRSTILTLAAAAVTVLKERGDCPSIPKAEQAVARATGIERRQIKTHRDTLNRGLTSRDVAQAYKILLAKVRGLAGGRSPESPAAFGRIC